MINWFELSLYFLLYLLGGMAVGIILKMVLDMIDKLDWDNEH